MNETIALASRRPDWRNFAVPLVLFGALALAPLALGGDRFFLSLVSRAMIFAIAALSLDFILGLGALVSFGHAAFIGIGAYAAGIAMEHGQDEGLFILPIAMLAGGAFALFTGAISLKTRGVYFIMITLAFGQMAFFTAQSLSRYGGDDGLRMAGRALLVGTKLLSNDTALFYLVLGCLAGAYALFRVVSQSRFGRVLRGAKDNERRMRAMGFDPYRYRLAAYVLSGAVAALAGALLAQLSTFVSPAYMSWQRSGELIVMVVAGGMGTLYGAILGALGVLLVEEALAAATQHWKAAFGLIVLALALFARGGLAGLMGRRP